MLASEQNERDRRLDELWSAVESSPGERSRAIAQLRFDLDFANRCLLSAIGVLCDLRGGEPNRDWSAEVPPKIDELFELLDGTGLPFVLAGRTLGEARGNQWFGVDEALVACHMRPTGLPKQRSAHIALWSLCASEMLRLFGWNVEPGPTEEHLERTHAFWKRVSDDSRREIGPKVRQGLQGSVYREDVCDRWAVALGEELDAADVILRDAWAEVAAADVVEAGAYRDDGKAGADLVTLRQLAKEVGSPYSTLASRRQRAKGKNKPEPVKKNSAGEKLYRRRDWQPILDEVRSRQGEQNA